MYRPVAGLCRKQHRPPVCQNTAQPHWGQKNMAHNPVGCLAWRAALFRVHSRNYSRNHTLSQQNLLPGLLPMGQWEPERQGQWKNPPGWPVRLGQATRQ